MNLQMNIWIRNNLDMHTGDSKEIVSHAYKSYIYIGL